MKNRQKYRAWYHDSLNNIGWIKLENQDNDYESICLGEMTVQSIGWTLFEEELEWDQCTGLTDLNNKLIYENDWVHIVSEEILTRVMWVEQSAGFEFVEVETGMAYNAGGCDWNGSCFIVVGNLRDNPNWEELTIWQE